MANIRVDVDYTITNGSEVSFTAPCDCTEVTGLKVYHQGGSKSFTFRDSHGQDLTGIGNLFAAGAIVKVLLDVANGHAYLQNADTNRYLEDRINKAHHANLLDNWYFGNPVNQRGQTVYDGSGYCIDRWKNGAVSVIEGEGLKAVYADSIIVQSLEAELKAAIDGKECTVSVLCDGVMNTNTFTYTAAPSAATLVMYGENVNVTILTGGAIHIAFRAVNSVIQAVKLELGDSQTLAHEENGVWVLNEIPDYGTELLKCQRYFYKFNKYLLPCMSFGNAAWWFTLDFPVPMRATPAIVGLDTGKLMAGGSPLSGATFELGQRTAEQVNVTCYYSTFDSAQKYSVSYIDGYAYASADL